MTEADEIIPDHLFREISDVALWAIEDRSERAQTRRRPTLTDGSGYLASPEEMAAAVADSAADVPRLIAEVRHLTELVESARADGAAEERERITKAIEAEPRTSAEDEAMRVAAAIARSRS